MEENAFSLGDSLGINPLMNIEILGLEDPDVRALASNTLGRNKSMSGRGKSPGFIVPPGGLLLRSTVTRAINGERRHH